MTIQDEANDLANIKIIEGCMIFNEVTGHFFHANESAIFIFERLKEQMSVPTIIEIYQEHFNITRHVAERDIELFLNDLQVVR